GGWGGVGVRGTRSASKRASSLHLRRRLDAYGVLSAQPANLLGEPRLLALVHELRAHSGTDHREVGHPGGYLFRNSHQMDPVGRAYGSPRAGLEREDDRGEVDPEDAGEIPRRLDRHVRAEGER